MKRQPKPFAVEIKRSRRSPLPSSSSKIGSLKGGESVPGERGSPENVPRPSSDAEPAVPAFLQSDKKFHRPASMANRQEVFTNKDQVFASAPPPRTNDAQPPEERARPRILPSLIPNASAEPGAQTKPARKIRSGKAASDVDPKKTPRKGRKDHAGPAPVVAAKADTGSRLENTPSQRPVSAVRSSPIGKRSIGKRSEVANSHLSKEKTPKPTAAVFVAPAFKADAPGDDRDHASRIRSLAKRGRHDAADLPLGQRWKRRLHPRAW